ncbi:MAG: Cof-type HAD-IIB family hydrolase [Lachnospiraceae bacterium]|nr:Cof-type HAD-IIB family hydrolase [Lachnospiraceae bacterium]
MNTKIIFFDIDGTIYKYNEGMPNDTLESIIKLKQKGHIPVLCTGRTKVMIYDEFLKPGFEYIIAGSGTYIQSKDNVDFFYKLDNDEVEHVADAFKRYGFSPVIEGRDNLFVEFENESRTPRGNKIIANYRKNIGDKCIDIGSNPFENVSKASGVFMPGCDMNGMIKEFSDDYSIINHNNDLLELVPKPYNKAKAIEKLIANLGISHENTYAFGDSFNDLEMLTYVKYGICMGNSDEELFQYTQYRTEDYNKFGITNALKRFNLI